MASMDAQKAAVIVKVAKNLQIKDPKWLDAVIKHESGYSPTIQNLGGYNAHGLIQFTQIAVDELHDKIPGFRPKTPRELVQMYPTFEAQMNGPVYWYYSLQRKPYGSLHDVAMATFLPAYRTKSETTEFPDWVKRANPGLDRPKDYNGRLRRLLNSPTLALNQYGEEAYRIAGYTPSSGSNPLPLIAGAALVVGGYLIWTRS